MSENRTGRYLKYAIGEILLVVIGILIALNINNWNENRKERLLEQQILIDIKKSLVSDLNGDIKQNIKSLSQDIVNINSISKMINEALPFNDSMIPKFRSLMFSKNLNWEVTAYMALENQGVNLIQNQELKDAILTVYNSNYPNTKGRLQNFLNNLNSFFRPMMRERFIFQYEDNYEHYLPLDYDALKNDHIFKNALNTSQLNFKNMQISFNGLKLEVEQTIELIDAELNTNR